MADEIIIETVSAEVIEVGTPGPQGPAGAAGTGLETLTTKGDTLYRGDTTGERLAIGTTGQILKVSAGGVPTWANESGAVTSVAGKTGAVTLDKNDVGLGNVTNAAQVTSVTGTAPIVSSGGTTPAISISAATTSAAGSMSSADKTKLDGIASGAEVNVNADWNASSGDAQILNKPTSLTPTSHSASHAAAGSDPVTLDVSQVASVNGFGNVWGGGETLYDVFANAGNVFFSDQSDFAAASHTHAASAITSGTLGIARIPTGTGSTQVALGNHTHELTALAATGATNGHVLTANGSGGVTFAAASGGGVTAVNSTLADILSVSGSDLVADDLAADKLYGWDDSAGKAIGFTIGSGLSVSGDTLTATASGGSKTYAVFTAEHNQPPSTAFATLDTRNSIAVLDFDAATDENAVFVGIMPEAASLGSGLIVRLHWMATTATSGNVRWGVQFERSNTDLDADSFDTAVEATAAANGTSGILTTAAITVTTIDGITAGDVFRLKVFRNADDATNDTMTGDAELVAVEVRSAA